VLFLIIIWMSSSYRDMLGENQSSFGPYALALASALLFFGSILLHELGHAFVSIRHGIGISGITLWMFGGIARMERDSDSPGTEFKIAIAGPIVTALIVIACVGAGLLVSNPNDFGDAARAQGTHVSGAVALLAWLGSINVLLLLFNLVPAFPLDGGRIARAIAWKRTGSRNAGTRIAGNLGQGFGLLLIVAGILYFGGVQGDFISAVWFIFLGIILRGAARSAIAQTEITDRIEGISVADVMDREPVAIPQELSVEQALDEYFHRDRWRWSGVVDAARTSTGPLAGATADQVPPVERASATVKDVFAPDSGAIAVPEDTPLEALLGNEALRRLGAVVATDADGHISGVIKIDAIGRALRPTTPGAPGATSRPRGRVQVKLGRSTEQTTRVPAQR